MLCIAWHQKCTVYSMAIWVVEFSNGGYKIRNILPFFQCFWILQKFFCYLLLSDKSPAGEVDEYLRFVKFCLNNSCWNFHLNFTRNSHPFLRFFWSFWILQEFCCYLTKVRSRNFTWIPQEVILPQYCNVPKDQSKTDLKAYNLKPLTYKGN